MRKHPKRSCGGNQYRVAVDIQALCAKSFYSLYSIFLIIQYVSLTLGCNAHQHTDTKYVLEWEHCIQNDGTIKVNAWL